MKLLSTAIAAPLFSVARTMETGANFLFRKVGSSVIKFHGLFRVLHSVHRGVESSEKKCFGPLDIF